LARLAEAATASVDEDMKGIEKMRRHLPALL